MCSMTKGFGEDCPSMAKGMYEKKCTNGEDTGKDDKRDVTWVSQESHTTKEDYTHKLAKGHVMLTVKLMCPDCQHSLRKL